MRDHISAWQRTYNPPPLPLPFPVERQLDEQIAAMERKIEAVKHAQEAEARIAAKREQLARLTAELKRLVAK